MSCRFSFVLTQKILKAHNPPEEFVLAVVYAGLGYGKSAYHFKVSVECLMRTYGISETEAWETLKTLIVFHPEQFFNKLDNARSMGLNKILLMDWDDAGYWLNAMDWDDPFVEALTKWLNVARTDITGLLCSTPTPTMIFRKLRNFPSAITVRITKHTGDGHKWRRLATGYLQWVLPDLKKTRVRKLFIDEYSCRLPNEFFKWYKPLRDAYAKMALKAMKERWEESKAAGKSKAILLEENPELELPNLNLPR